jgi:hypothetical protein
MRCVAGVGKSADQSAGEGDGEHHAEGDQSAADGAMAGRVVDGEAIVGTLKPSEHDLAPLSRRGLDAHRIRNARTGSPFPKMLGGWSRSPHLEEMIRPALLALLLLSGAAPVGAQTIAAPASAAPSAQALQGQTVRGAKGVVLGVVERVVSAAGGRPSQILVRPKGLHPGGARSLSVAGVTLGPDGVTTPITKAEFDAMPAIDLSDR